MYRCEYEGDRRRSSSSSSSFSGGGRWQGDGFGVCTEILGSESCEMVPEEASVGEREQRQGTRRKLDRQQRTERREFPPPIRWLQMPKKREMRAERKDGRLIVKEEVRVNRETGIFRVERQDGRLRLFLSESEGFPDMGEEEKALEGNEVAIEEAEEEKALEENEVAVEEAEEEKALEENEVAVEEAEEERVLEENEVAVEEAEEEAVEEEKEAVQVERWEWPRLERWRRFADAVVSGGREAVQWCSSNFTAIA